MHGALEGAFAGRDLNETLAQLEKLPALGPLHRHAEGHAHRDGTSKSIRIAASQAERAAGAERSSGNEQLQSLAAAVGTNPREYFFRYDDFPRTLCACALVRSCLRLQPRMSCKPVEREHLQASGLDRPTQRREQPEALHFLAVAPCRGQ